MRHTVVCLVTVVLFSFEGLGQDSLDIRGQLSGFVNFAPDNDLNFMLSGRYLPEVNYAIKFKNEQQLDFEAAANIYGM